MVLIITNIVITIIEQWSLYGRASKGFCIVSVIGVVTLNKAAFIPTGLATALTAHAATQAAKQHDKQQKWERALVAADNRRRRVLVSA